MKSSGEGPAGVVTVPVTQLADLVEDLGLLGLGGLVIAVRELAGDRLALGQREPYLLPPPGLTLPRG
jgi:hypothetical protein